MGKIKFNDLYQYDLNGKDYEFFYPKRAFTKIHLPETIFFKQIDADDLFFEHLGVLYILNCLIAFAHCNPSFDITDIKRMLNIMIKLTETTVPMWVKDKILSEMEILLEEKSISETVEQIKSYPNTRKHISNPRAIIFDSSLEQAERNKLNGESKTFIAQKKGIELLKTILTNWKLNRYGTPTNHNLAKHTNGKLSEETIRKSYSPYLKKEKELAKHAKNKWPITHKTKDPNLFYDTNGIGYNIEYLSNTNEEIHFPWKPNYSVNNFGEICKKKKPTSIDKDGLTQVTIDGKRIKKNPKKVLNEILPDDFIIRQKPLTDPIPNLFEMSEKELINNIANEVPFDNQKDYSEIPIRGRVEYEKNEQEWIDNVKKRKRKFYSNKSKKESLSVA